MANTDNKHQHILRDLLYSKEKTKKILNLEGVIYGAMEVPYWKDGELYCEIDLLLYTGGVYHKPYHVVEYKRSEDKLKIAYPQLFRAEEFVNNILHSACYKYFVYGEDDNLRCENIGQHPHKRK